MDTYARARAEQVINPILLAKTRGAKPPVTKQELETGDVKELTLDSSDPGASASYLVAPSAPFDIQAEQARGKANQQQGSVPDQMISGSNDPQYAAAMLQAQLSDIGERRLNAYKIPHTMQAKTAMERLIRKFVAIKGEIKDLEGEHLKKYNGVFKADFSWKEIPRLWRIEPKHELLRSIDKLAAVQVAEAKLKAGAISMRSFQEEIGTRDPQAEDEMRLREELKNNPIAKENRLRQAALDEMLEAKQEVAEMNADANATEEQKATVAYNARVAEAIFKDIDRRLSGNVQAALQGQVGKEAPQPNEPEVMATPRSSIQPPEARGEGSAQRQAAMMGSQNGNQ